jgi:nucleoside-diphosphate-sugar epimerase
MNDWDEATLRDTPRRALVTGATGYVGRNLALGLLAAGWDVHATVRPRSSTLIGGVVAQPIDGTYRSIDAAIRQARPSVVLHVASRVVVAHEAEDVADLIESNVTFPTQLLEAMIANRVTRFVDTGTSWQHFHPEAAYSPTNLYAATKQAFQDICQFYVEAHELNTVQLKLFDVYGPDDHRNKIIPLLVRLCRSSGALAMSGGAQRMDMVFITDVVAAYLVAAERLLNKAEAGYESYAVRSGETFSLRQIVEELERQIGCPLNIEWGGRPYRDREVMEPWARYDRLPGWSSKVSLQEGLRRVLTAADIACV